MTEVDEGAHIGVFQMLFSLRDHGGCEKQTMRNVEVHDSSHLLYRSSESQSCPFPLTSNRQFLVAPRVRRPTQTLS